MGLLLKDPLHDQFACWALGYAPYGGADAGEVVAIARVIADGDDSAYYDAWTAAADRLVEEGDACLGKEPAPQRARILPPRRQLLQLFLSSAVWRAGRLSPAGRLPQADERVRQGHDPERALDRAAADPVRKHDPAWIPDARHRA